MRSAKKSVKPCTVDHNSNKKDLTGKIQIKKIIKKKKGKKKKVYDKAYFKESVSTVLDFNTCLKMHFLSMDSPILWHLMTHAGNAWRLRQPKSTAGDNICNSLFNLL